MKIQLSVFVIAAISSCVNSDTEVHGKFFGRGVCSVHLNDEKVVDVNELHYYNVTDWEFCWKFPPWCDVVVSEAVKYGSTTVKIPHEHLKLKCCPGYKSNAQRTACLPRCSALCAKDHCVDVGNCTLCIADYAGPSCDKKIGPPSGRADSGSSVPKCNCTDDNYVCASNGTCICAPGFEGVNCETLIEPSAFIHDPGARPSCMSYFVRVSVFLALLVLSFVLVLAYLRRHYDFTHFRPLLEESAPSTSRNYTSI